VKAIVAAQYGPPEVLQLQEVEKPVPTGGQVLVRVHAASVNALDWRRFTLAPILVRVMGLGGRRKPKNPRLGVDVAGTVEAVGSQVKEALWHKNTPAARWSFKWRAT
jgi:NADPH:quinone reductase-like Zn-dependent oxidoreductase